MNKKILLDYIDACELIKETEQDIKKLEEKKKTIITDHVKGSMQEFPYTAKTYKVQGTAYQYEDDKRLRYEEKLLEERKRNAELIKTEVELYLCTLPPRMQRIIKWKYLEGLPWERVAIKIGRRATGDSVRMELDRFFREK